MSDESVKDSFEKDGKLLMVKYSPVWEHWATGGGFAFLTFLKTKSRPFVRYVYPPIVFVTFLCGSHMVITNSRIKNAVLNDTFSQDFPDSITKEMVRKQFFQKYSQKFFLIKFYDL